MASTLPHDELNADPIDALLSAHGLRRTTAARRVLGWLLAHPDTSYTHAQLQAALAGEGDAADGPALDRVTLYRLIDRLTQVGLLLCRVDGSRVRLENALQASAGDLERAAQSALAALKALGYQGMSLDFAVRGVCADCATGSTGGHRHRGAAA